MINNVVLIGRLTKDADLRSTQTGKSVANFTLAVNRKYKKEGQPEADFINCVAWNKTAELLGDYTRKGSQVGVEGNIQTRNYENNEGQRVYMTEVVVQSVTFLDSKKENSQTSPYQKNDYTSNHFESGSNAIDINDDFLPF
ncbi:single-stranded DNA-binding protein [Pisciglobus halotolerans]|uniref:Single-stranded DNA-binding protein n=1 Tax=Pisciglobus halotolerans TaxID=745365 RepID=A0A1I3BIT1_9LACT|nr:single-stranded DNA-binding protein [Pisciglobus halotolerans]SFH62162.1 single-strand DNA-binding protein [Pisciglobus halotolerans]